MVLTIITIPLFVKLLSKLSSEKLSLCLKIFAMTMLFFDPAYWLWEWLTYRSFDFSTTLPLYICSLYWILLPFAVFAKESLLKRISLAFLVSIGFISGILGFVFNTHVALYPLMHFVVLRSLLYHYLMMLISTLLWKSGYYQPQYGDNWLAFIPVMLLLVPNIILNHLFGYDYGYTGGGQGTIFTILSDRLPLGLFLLVVYATFYLTTHFIFYRKYPLFKLKQKKVLEEC